MPARAFAMGTAPQRTTSEASGPITLRETGLSPIGRGSLLADKYRLEMLLGEGGMGFVWSAYNRELELPVAIKLLRSGRHRHRLAERLRLEARAAARLLHPSIVRIFDVAVTEAGDPFIVMELLTGQTLANALARGPLDPVRAVQLLLPIADALAHAHAKGVVHRDLKPENVFLSTDGEQVLPKLLDFGIAKLGYGGPSYPKLTEDGVVLGSPHYMSPEQVAGEEVDPRTDTWSLTVVLYKAVTGNAPFTGPDKRAVMDAILREPPAAIAEDASIDAGLRDILRWGLSKDLLDRPQSIRDLGRALARWLLQQGIAEDVCGTPLAAKWLLPAARVTVPCGPPSECVPEHDDTDPEQRWFTSQPPLAPAASPPSEVAVRRPRPRPRPLIAALGLLVFSCSLAWTDSARTSVKAASPAAVERSGSASPRARAQRNHAPRAHVGAAPAPAPAPAPQTSEPMNRPSEASNLTPAAPALRSAPPKRSQPATRKPPPQLPF
ncbi:MAG: serine/threonine protein kinase [Myxococcales bacterium]|nr:MAG: serine/threonine protein kinase [Myxococcales bacterium]